MNNNNNTEFRITIRESNKMGLGTARCKVEELAKELESKYKIQWGFQQGKVVFRCDSGIANGLKGIIQVSNTEISFDAVLPSSLRLFGPAIEKAVKLKITDQGT